MLFSVRTGNASLGLVDLPAGRLVAARLERSPEYDAVAAVVREATDAFLHLGLFDAVAPMLPPISADRRRWRRALALAARLRLTLADTSGEDARADFVNLLESPSDGGIVVLASFATEASAVGALLSRITQGSRSGAPAR